MKPQSAHSRFSWRALAVIGAIVLLTAAAWRWTPLRQYADAEAAAALLAHLRESPWAPLAILAIYLLANAMLFPNTVLNVAVILGLGTRVGLPIALGASLITAMAYFFAGRRYRHALRRYAGSEQMERLAAQMAGAGVLGVATLRLLPIAPFTVVNVAAGALRVRPLAFAGGTFLGLLPGNLLVTAFGHQLREMLHKPSVTEGALLAAVLLLAGFGAWWLRRRAQTSMARAPEKPSGGLAV